MASDNSIRQGQHTLVDMSLNWTSVDKHYDVNLFVRNLTNQYTYAAALVSSNFAVVPGAPRTFGVTLGYHY
jgi:outer membrane receptor protein involved in Fe transport